MIVNTRVSVMYCYTDKMRISLYQVIEIKIIVMKKFLFAVMALSIILFSCKKDKDGPLIIKDAVTDIDGNSYDAVKIGDQVWMALNLRTTHYANGDAAIYHKPPTTDIANYGLLYDWHVTMHEADGSTANPSGVQGICPNGWHVPSDAEWHQMAEYLDSDDKYVSPYIDEDGIIHNYCFLIAKSLAANWGWQTCDYGVLHYGYFGDEQCPAIGKDLSSNNTTGFNALPAGYFDGTSNGFEFSATFWSATAVEPAPFEYSSALTFTMQTNSPDVGFGGSYQFVGNSVRCLRN